jgi:hypothetical protein
MSTSLRARSLLPPVMQTLHLVILNRSFASSPSRWQISTITPNIPRGMIGHGLLARSPKMGCDTEKVHGHGLLPGAPGQRGGGAGKLVAFYQLLKSKVGLAAAKAAAKAAALRISHNVEGCGIVAAPVHAPSRAPFLLPLLLSDNLPLPRVH